ncbi:MAG: hypothetical protein ACFFDN_00275 [Candidatus Hodarchaeota archaeon]
MLPKKFSQLPKIKEKFLPIAGNPGLGYYIIETPQELRETLASLDSRIRKTSELMFNTTMAFYKFHQDINFEFSGETFDETLDDDEEEDEN